MNYDIYIVGSGIVSIDQMTKEAERAISKSNEVLYVDNGVGVFEYLSNRCENVTDLLSTSYVSGEHRLKAYQNMAARVVEAALLHPPVTYLLYGHPTVFAYPPELIQKLADLLDLKVKIYPGISAMDCIFAELHFDPGANGLQIYEASDILLRHIPLLPDIPALIWQIGALETSLYSSSRSKPSRFRRFEEYLLKYYPIGHVAKAIYCSSHPLAPSTITEFPIDKIHEFSEHLHSGYTLYIPRTAPRLLRDKGLAKEMESVKHLKSITYHNDD